MINRLKPKSDFARNVVTLMTGTAIAQAIPIAIMPILTRLYTPEDFGLLALFMALFSILSTISTGRYELAVMAPATNEKAQDVVFLSILVALGVLMVTGPPIWLFNSEIASLLGNPEIGVWLCLLPLIVFSSGVYQSIDYWLNRQNRYKDMAGNKLIQAGSVSLAQAMLFHISRAGLVLGSVMGWVLSALFVVRKSRLQFRDFDFRLSRKMAIRYKEYPLFQAPFSLLNSMSSQAPIFFITKAFDAGIVGFYSLVIRILSAPAALIAKSTGQVYFQRVSLHARSAPELLLNDLYEVGMKLFVIALMVFTPVLFYGAEMFIMVFGDGWAQAGAYAQVLVIAIAVKFVVSPLSTIFMAIDKIKVGAFWQLVYFLTTILMLFLAVLFEFETFVWIYVVHELFLYTFYFMLMIYSVKAYIYSNMDV